MQERLVKVEYTTEKKNVINLMTERSLEDLRNVYTYLLGGNVKDLTITEIAKCKKKK